MIGKVAFLTGAARGIGRACAIRLAEEGADLLLVDIGVVARLQTVHDDLGTAAELEHTAQRARELGVQVVTRYVDVRDGGALRAAAEIAEQRLGSIDVLVPAAGVVSTAPAWAMSDAQWRTVLDINLTGAWQTAKAVAPAMMRQRSGSIVFVRPSLAHRPGEERVHEAVAGQGVVGLVRAFGAELGPYGARVNSVAVAALGRSARSDRPANGLLPGVAVEPRDVAEAVLFLASDRSRCITGTSVIIDLGASLAA